MAEESSRNKQKFIDLLYELFQLNEPELDFGLYRIMHAKSAHIKRFIEEELSETIDQAFAEGGQDRIAKLKARYEQELEKARSYGAPTPEDAPAVKDARGAYEESKAKGDEPSEIYDHLYRFFSRYYDAGDFLSRRYHVAENDSRAAPFAVPYDGREVYLHWANKDQYYIKSSETVTHYTFDLNAALRKLNASQGGLALGNEAPLKVHFRVVEASEGAHGNVKESQSRFFMIHGSDTAALQNGELNI